MTIICFLKGIWNSILSMQKVSGHNYIEVYDNNDIQVLECELCGHISLGYKGGEL